jgi:hypothetical protein
MKKYSGYSDYSAKSTNNMVKRERTVRSKALARKSYSNKVSAPPKKTPTGAR